MLRLTSVISLPKLIQNTSMRPGFLRLEIITPRLNQNQGSFSSFGAKLWNAIPNEFRQLSKGSFKKHFHDLLLSIMERFKVYFTFFTGKFATRRSRRHSTTCFSSCCSDRRQLSSVTSLITLRSAEASNFSGDKKKINFDSFFHVLLVVIVLKYKGLFT